jgi:hypothetical protein
VRAAKIDANHRQIQALFEAHGVRWKSTAALPGFCDAVAQVGNRTALIEIKDGTKRPSARKLTPAQVAFHRDWLVFLVTNETRAIEVIAWLKSA